MLDVWRYQYRGFVNTGDPDQPIQRMNGAFLEHGCAAPHSVAKLDNTVFWVGKDANGQAHDMEGKWIHATANQHARY